MPTIKINTPDGNQESVEMRIFQIDAMEETYRAGLLYNEELTFFQKLRDSYPEDLFTLKNFDKSGICILENEWKGELYLDHEPYEKGELQKKLVKYGKAIKDNQRIIWLTPEIEGHYNAIKSGELAQKYFFNSFFKLFDEKNKGNMSKEIKSRIPYNLLNAKEKVNLENAICIIEDTIDENGWMYANSKIGKMQIAKKLKNKEQNNKNNEKIKQTECK